MRIRKAEPIDLTKSKDPVRDWFTHLAGEITAAALEGADRPDLTYVPPHAVDYIIVDFKLTDEDT